jgi:dihydroorotate dehydrogenase (NAD+) catalytic subunit
VQDALEFFFFFSKVIQVGTANFVNPRITVEIISGLQDYLYHQGLTDINDIIGALEVPQVPAAGC